MYPMKSVHHHLPTKPFSIPCLKTSWVGGTKNWHLYDLAKGRVWNLIKTHFWWNWWNSFGDKAKNGHWTKDLMICLFWFFLAFLVCADLKIDKNWVYFNCPLMMFKVFRHQLFFQCLRECWAPVWHQWNQFGKNPHGCQSKLWWKFCLTHRPITKKLQATVGIWDFIRS